MRRTSSNSDPASEAAFLSAYDATEYDRPSVAVDIVLLTLIERRLRVALLRRGEHPSKGRWALPGGFVRPSESLDDAAARTLREKAGLEHVFFEQLYTFGDPARDPRTRVISVSYFALIDAARLRTDLLQHNGMLAMVDPQSHSEAGSPLKVRDANGVELPLAFDHAAILRTAVLRLRGKLDYTPVGYQLLPSQFTLRSLQDVHETVLGRMLNKDAFRRRMLASGELHATGSFEANVGHRPAELYRFVAKSAV